MAAAVDAKATAGSVVVMEKVRVGLSLCRTGLILHRPTSEIT